MTAGILVSPRAFVVWFRDLLRWDVAFFREVKWHWPNGVIRPLGEAMMRRRVEVDPKADRAALPIISKILAGDPFYKSFNTCRILPSALGDDAVLLGAVRLVKSLS